MILENLYLFRKRDRIIAIIITIITALCLITLWAYCVYIIAHGKDLGADYKTILIAIISTFNIAGIVVLSKKIIFKLIWIFITKQKKQDFSMLPAKCSSAQQNLCISVNNDGYNSLVHIYGYPNCGKTTSALYVLKSLFHTDVKSIIEINKIILIDCSSGKEEILSFIEKLNDDLNKIKNSVIIIDNIELMGIPFINENLNLFRSNKSIIILIEDSTGGTTKFNFSTTMKVNQHDFNGKRKLYNEDKELEISFGTNYNIIKKFKGDKLEAFLSIVIAVFIQKYVTIELLGEKTNISPKIILSIIKQLQPSGLISLFPFNNKIIYSPKSYLLKQVLRKYENDEKYNSILTKFTNEKYLDPEFDWILLILRSTEYLKNIKMEEKMIIFNNSLKKGIFPTLFQLAQKVIEVSPDKKDLFLYELGILNYYMGNAQKAFELYNEIILRTIEDDKMKLMVRIIEAIHGNIGLARMADLKSYIDLLKKNSKYKIYGKYWDAHIKIEKGIFNIDEMSEILIDISNKESHSDYMYEETVKRCYTDILRCHYILGLDIPRNLTDRFECYLNSVSAEMYEFYSNFYINAFQIQYIDLPELGHMTQACIIREYVNHAKQYYNAARDSNYHNERTLITLSIRELELESYNENANFELIILELNKFKEHVSGNELGLHLAYANTLAAKFKILSNHLMNDSIGCEGIVNNFLKKALTSYEIFGNQYGIFRIKFIKLLLELYIGSNQSETVDSMKALVSDEYKIYTREKKIYENIKALLAEQPLNEMSIRWIIKSYPIILQ